MESPVLTSVNPVEAVKPSNPWGSLNVNVSSLATVMDEELARELDRNDGSSSWDHDNVPLDTQVEGRVKYMYF